MLKFLFAMFLLSSTLYGADFTVKSLDEAKTLSKSTKQPILVIFGSDNCSFCTKLKDDISNGQLTEYVDPYIICYIDLKDNEEYETKYKVSIIPDSRIFMHDKEISKAVGYNKNDYSKWLINNAK